MYNEVALLRLFKRGNVSIPFADIIIRDNNGREIAVPCLSCLGPDYVETDKFTLSSQELQSLAEFMNYFRNEQLPSDLVLPFSAYETSFDFPRNWPFLTANGAVVPYGSLVSFLVSMIGLESLVNDNPNAVTETISRNLSLLMGMNETDSKEIYKCMKRIYDERSKIIHGSIFSKRVLNEFEKYRLKARDYLREGVKNAWVAKKKLNLSREQLLEELDCVSFCSRRPWRDEKTDKFLFTLSGCENEEK